MFVHNITSSGIGRCSECIPNITFANIYTFISDKSSLVSIDSDIDLIIISSLLTTVLLSCIHKAIEFISENTIFSLTHK